jgi:hypothetical protein
MQGNIFFDYISPIPRLRTMFADPYISQKLNYRRCRTVEVHKTQDVFDGAHFKELLNKDVTWDGQYPAGPRRRYFDQDTDIALQLSLDGVPLHKRTGLDAWPLLLTVYSLGPEMRYKKENQICCGVIPGMFQSSITTETLSFNLLTIRRRQQNIPRQEEQEGGLRFFPGAITG